MNKRTAAVRNEAAAPVTQLSALRALLPLLRPYRGRVALALGLLCLGSATVLVLPLAFRDLVDSGFGTGTAVGGGLLGTHSLDAHFLVLFALAALWALLVSARHYAVSWVGERVTADLRSAVYGSVLRQSPVFFETLQTGEVLSRLSGDTTLVQAVIGSSASMGLRSLLQFAGGMAMLAATSPWLFGIIFTLLLVLALPIMLIGRRVRSLSRDSQDRIADASALAGEILNSMPTVQACTQEAFEARRFAERCESAFHTAIRRTRVRAALTAMVIGAVIGSIVFVLWIGARQVQAGSLSLGELGAFVLYAALVAGAVGTLAEVWGDLMRASGATARLMELLHARPAIADGRGAAQTPDGQMRIDFDDVVFCYPARPQVRALDGIRLHIEAGERVAVVGPSGSGKSTLFQVLLRYYDVSTGSIRIDGRDLRDFRLQALRSEIAIVPQEVVIFAASVSDNIRYGRPEASDEEVLRAARAAAADEFITRLPDGYRSFLGERGTRLSGGQRQRIAIARTILRDARLLLLDEATSALDAESERLVQQGLAAAMQGRTSLVITHRLATVQQVDRIVVMEAGRIVETGTPADLRRQGGLYARLAALQLDL